MGYSEPSACNLISIIVLNWNGQSLLDECLSALSRQTYSPYELIFVDNGSTDGSIDFVRKKFPWVSVCQLSENRGFSGGNIEGFKKCRGEFIALVNNDTRVDETWLENLVHPLHENPSTGICASKLLIESTGKIDSAGDNLTSWGVGLKRGSGEERSSYDTQEPVFGACAAACLYRRKMIEDIGFLDEDFFFNDEDTDLNFRAQLRGWKCVYVPKAVVYHKVNATIGTRSDRHVYFHVRNLEFLWIKNMPTGLMVRFAHYKVLQEIGSFAYLCLRHGKWAPYFEGKKDAVRMLPLMLRKRGEIQKRKAVTNQYIKSLLVPVFSKEFICQKVTQFIFG